MSGRTVGEILDEIVGYTYHGVPEVTAAEVLEEITRAEVRVRRPRLARFDFSPYARTPVHDLPHDGVGTVALPTPTWDALMHEATEPEYGLPSGMNIVALFGVAVEAWS